MHKYLLLATLVAAAACGGGSKPAPTPPAPPPSPCVAVSQHMRDMVMKAGQEEQAGADMLNKLGPIIERVVSERCQADAWSPEVIACINGADDKTMDPCIDQLTDDQEKALESDIERELDPIMKEELKKQEGDGATPAGAPAPGGGAPPPPEDPDGGGA